MRQRLAQPAIITCSPRRPTFPCRYVALASSSELGAQLCSFAVGLAAPPATPAEAEGGGGLSGGAIAGIVCACIAGAATTFALFSYCSWRRSYLRRLDAIEQRRLEAAKRHQEWLGGPLAHEGEADDGLGSGGTGMSGPSGTLGILCSGGGLGMQQASEHLVGAGPSGGGSSTTTIPTPAQWPSSGVGGLSWSSPRGSVSSVPSGKRSSPRSKVSELQLIEAFIKTVSCMGREQGRGWSRELAVALPPPSLPPLGPLHMPDAPPQAAPRMPQLRKKSESGSSKRESGEEDFSVRFGRVDTNSSPVDASRAATDLSKLPEGFASGVWLCSAPSCAVRGRA